MRSHPCITASFFLFFFSSRRRHTRCLSDWSSDVCSSDLDGGISFVGTNEGDTAIITVNRTSGAGAAATLNFTVSGGTATGGAACGAGVDYITPASLVLNFAAGDTAKSFNIVTCTDGLYEGNETVPLT